MAENSSISLFCDTDGQLFLYRGNERLLVFATLCFPWTDPDHYLSLKDIDGKEIMLIKDFKSLDKKSYEAIQLPLAHARFSFEITAIASIKEDFQLRVWTVTTTSGPRRFLTHMDTWPLETPDGAYIIKDLEGDYYRISQLDDRSNHLFWAFRS